jgi:hypothetical protein
MKGLLRQAMTELPAAVYLLGDLLPTSKSSYRFPTEKMIERLLPLARRIKGLKSFNRPEENLAYSPPHFLA